MKKKIFGISMPIMLGCLGVFLFLNKNKKWVHDLPLIGSFTKPKGEGSYDESGVWVSTTK